MFIISNGLSFLKGRSAHNRASDRSTDDRLYCNDKTGYPEKAANSIVAGHLLRQIIKEVRQFSHIHINRKDQ